METPTLTDKEHQWVREYIELNKEHPMSQLVINSLTDKQEKLYSDLENRFIALAGKVPHCLGLRNAVMLYRLPVNMFLNNKIELLTVLENTPTEFWLQANKTADNAFNFVEKQGDRSVYEQELLVVSDILIKSGKHIIPETAGDKNNRYAAISKTATTLRRLLQNDPDLNYSDSSIGLKLTALNGIELEITNFFTELNIDSFESKNLLGNIQQHLLYSPAILETIEHIESTYSAVPQPAYKGRKKPSAQSLISAELSEWFVKCGDAPHKKLCFQAATTLLKATSPDLRLAKHQS